MTSAVDAETTVPSVPALPALPGAVVHIACESCSLWTVNKWLPFDETEVLLAHLRTLPMLRHPETRMGKLRRSITFLCDTPGVSGYRFSGQETAASPLTPPLRAFLERVNRDLGMDFNGLLINLYADGKETIGAHSDSEEGLATDGSVAALSLGAERIFRVRPKEREGGAAAVDVPTKHGQLLVMQGRQFQRLFTHEVPVQSKIHGPRYSITFRKHTA